MTRLARDLADTLNELLLPALLPVIAAYFAVRGLPYLIERIAL